MVKLDLASAQVVADKKGAVPGASFLAHSGNTYALLHLTRNEGKLLANPPVAAQSSAINLKGQIDVQLDKGDNLLAKWEFGFIQLAKQTASQFVYAGMTSPEGSMALNFAVPPAWPKDLAYEFCLDSDAKHMPYTNRDTPKTTAKTGGVTVKAEMDDHPFLEAPLLLDNTKTGKKNLIWRITWYFEALAVFVAREKKTSKIEPLAHVTWGFRSQATIKHVVRRGGRPLITMVEKDFPEPVVAKGPPADPAIARKITNYNTDPHKTFNALTDAAKKNVFTGGLSTFVESDRWPNGMPLDFVTK